MPAPLRIHYHRDFDGMVSAAVLARILLEKRDEQADWQGINYDQRPSAPTRASRSSISTSIRAPSTGSTTIRPRS
jgi:oligoribonuclease NrnB/cAMP/cGMP phosphodiesterase (DHH superfamily)